MEFKLSKEDIIFLEGKFKEILEQRLDRKNRIEKIRNTQKKIGILKEEIKELETFEHSPYSYSLHPVDSFLEEKLNSFEKARELLREAFQSDLQCKEKKEVDYKALSLKKHYL